MQLNDILVKKWFAPTVSGVVAFGVGATVGYFVGRKRGVQRLTQQVAAQLAEIYIDDEPKVDRNQMALDLPLGNIENIVENEDEIEILGPATEHGTKFLTKNGNQLVEDISQQLTPDIELTVDDTPVEPSRQNVFARNDDDWDYDQEILAREDKECYVIHSDEFIENENEFTQATVTYYAGDDIMADELDVPIYNYTEMMGNLKFGHGSGDPKVVYIRNTKMHMEWEVLLHSGYFAVEVAGLQLEQSYEDQDLSHSATRRFRDTD